MHYMFGIYSWFYIYLYLIFRTHVAFVSSTLKDAVVAETQVLPVDCRHLCLFA